MLWTTEDSLFYSRQRQVVFLFSKAFRSHLALTQPPIQWVSGSFFPGAERQGREANHSLPSTIEIKNDENCISFVPGKQLYLHLTPSVSSNFLTNFTTQFLEVASGTLEYFHKFLCILTARLTCRISCQK